MSETELLQAFAESRSDEAFAQLVQRYAGLVYSTAKRRLSNASLAEDITQIVFIRFAKTPPKLKSPGELAAWLHRTTVHATIDLWRSETRRRAREMEAVVMESATPETTVWEEISPKLDEALDQLSEDERQTLMLRFFNQKSMRELGVALGVSEDAAKMRVSRALERLRTQMGATAACTAVVLGGLLADRSVEAAPGQLVTRLSTMKLSALAGAGSLAGGASRAFKVSAGAAAVAVVTFVVVHFARTGHQTMDKSVAESSPVQAASNQTANANVPSINVAPVSAMATPAKVAMMFHVSDSQSGEPLPGTQIQVGYFDNAGGGEGHDLVTDSTGTAAIPVPDDKGKSPGGNVFVVAENHVPMAIQFLQAMPADFSIKLDPAMTVSGIIEDEEGQIVTGVKILVNNPGNRPGELTNVDFQTCPVTNRDDGSWSCSYIPFDYTNEIRFILRKKGYATTYPYVPVNRTGLSNLVLVINHGYVVTGRIIDSQDEPVAGAHIKVLTDEAGKDQSTKTDGEGFYTLEGVAGDTSIIGDYQAPPLKTNDDGAFVIRGEPGEGPLHVDLAIQAKGYAPQTGTVAFSSRTNQADFTLLHGNIFRGHLVDEAGHPIANAVVQTDWNNEGIRIYDWSTRTDVDGGFEWDFAPAGPVLFWITADGYQGLRQTPFVADGNEHRIVLKANSQH